MRLKLIPLFLLVISAGTLHAQQDFRPGYVILHSGDTLRGEINYASPASLSVTCRFRQGTEVRDYFPHEIAAYRFEDSKYFVSKELENRKLFLEYIIKGELDIYFLSDKGRWRYFVQKRGADLTELTYNEEEVVIEGKELLYKSKQHVGVLTYYMHDAPQLQSRINNFGQPGHKNLTELAEDYHNLVCEESQCVIYEKEKTYFKVTLEPFADVQLYRDSFNPGLFGAGLHVYMWRVPRSENIRFKTGLEFIYTQYDSIDFEMSTSGLMLNIKIPLQIQYTYPSHLIKPKVGVGLNLYSWYGPTINTNLGVNIRLTSNIELSFTTNVDVQRIDIGVFRMYVYTDAGLCINL
ncbi:MAG: hypothetical protein ABFS10_01025 [Bacteroidota bacterium]